MTTLNDLKSIPGYHYLATPFTRYPHGHAAAAYDAARIAAKLIDEGFSVFSPIVHSFHIARVGGLDQVDEELWVEMDAPFVAAASALIVGCLTGWDESVGVAHEIDAFQKAGKPVVFLRAEYGQ